MAMACFWQPSSEETLAPFRPQITYAVTAVRCCLSLCVPCLARQRAMSASTSSSSVSPSALFCFLTLSLFRGERKLSWEAFVEAFIFIGDVDRNLSISPPSSPHFLLAVSGCPSESIAAPPVKSPRNSRWKMRCLLVPYPGMSGALFQCRDDSYQEPNRYQTVFQIPPLLLCRS